MSLKTSLNKDFVLNLLLIANYFFHNKIKNDTIKKIINQKLKNLVHLINIKKADLDHYYLYLLNNNIIFNSNNYLFINLNLLKKLFRPEKRESKNNIILQPNFELLVKPEIDLSSFFFLIQFAELVNKDVVYKFIITENSLHNAFSHKVTANKINSFLLNKNDSNELPYNVGYLINDVFKRVGEIKIGYSSGYIKAESHILKSLINDNIIQKNIFKTISSNVCMLRNDINLWDMYFYLKSKKFFPIVDLEKVVKTNNDLQISLNNEEAENFLIALYTLKKIGFEHHININFNLLNNLCDRLENTIEKKAISKADEKADKYKQELKNSIKSYVLKSLKASLTTTPNLVLNKIAVNYEGDNPATTKKEIIKMIEFTLNHKLKLVVGYHSFSKSIEQFVVPKYLYDRKVLYFHNKETKEEESIVLKKIVFTALL